jgi:hypothetical protein
MTSTCRRSPSDEKRLQSYGLMTVGVLQPASVWKGQRVRVWSARTWWWSTREGERWTRWALIEAIPLPSDVVHHIKSTHIHLAYSPPWVFVSSSP